MAKKDMTFQKECGLLMGVCIAINWLGFFKTHKVKFSRTLVKG